MANDNVDPEGPTHFDRRESDVALRDVRGRLLRAEVKIEKLVGAMWGSEEGLGIQHELTKVGEKLDELLASDAKRLPRSIVLALWVASLAIAAVIAYASLGTGP